MCGAEDEFEWFHGMVECCVVMLCPSLLLNNHAGYHAFRDEMRKHVRSSDRILMVGCGNSLLSEDMYRDGYKV